MDRDDRLECVDPHSPLVCGPDEDEHDHSHDHSDISRSDRRLVIGAMAVTGVVMIAELAGGFLTNSLALVSDSLHMFTHFLSLLVALSAMFIAALPRNMERTFGLYRAEVLAALMNGLGLMLFSGFIIYEAYHRFLDRPDLEVGPMLAVAFIGLLANLVSAYLLLRAKRHDLNIKGAMAHMLADTISSGAIILVGIVMIFWPRYELDALVSVLIAVLVLIWSVRIIRDSSRILLELTPRDMDLDRVTSEMKEIKGVTDVHDIHAWEITTGMRMMTSHVSISRTEMKRDAGRRVTNDLKEMLKDRYQVVHTTFQLECPSFGGVDGDH
ncbi:MAG: cation diffusion facilitator family transporter [Thermoplasmatota archaeon]